MNAMCSKMHPATPRPGRPRGVATREPVNEWNRAYRQLTGTLSMAIMIGLDPSPVPVPSTSRLRANFRGTTRILRRQNREPLAIDCHTGRKAGEEAL
jgi:hypothetical protein